MIFGFGLVASVLRPEVNVVVPLAVPDVALQRAAAREAAAAASACVKCIDGQQEAMAAQKAAVAAHEAAEVLSTDWAMANAAGQRVQGVERASEFT